MGFLLQHLLNESAARYSGRTALIFKNRTLTYAELDRQSNKLAHLLQIKQSQKGGRVGIFLDRGIDSVIAAVAILKAGAVYVPIDPMSPARRINYIINKCGLELLITSSEKLARIDQAFEGNKTVEQLILVDRDSPDLEFQVDNNNFSYAYSLPEEFGEAAPVVSLIDTDIAYILFTSGSTGSPKGVMISHLNALTFINSAYDFFGFTPEDRFSNIAPLHFDMSIFDIFVAFKAGASVVIIPESTAIFPTKLAEYIAKNKITIWNSVPSALCLLASLKNLDTFDLSSLRLILFAGELFPIKYLQILVEILPAARFCNMYGQTEANSSTYYWVNELPRSMNEILPIGKALPNFAVFAVNETGSLVMHPGEEGELYVRSSTVAAGYLGETEKTAHSFVIDPVCRDLPGRVYRTGDLVRLDRNGNYSYLGRKDQMIKSRGYRIEIGEIETVLCNHPQIKTAVVIPIPDEMIGNRISVIIVPTLPGNLTREDVFIYCYSQLPKYMVPEMIEFRDYLPTTSSGKVDRQKLKGVQNEYVIT